MSGNSNGRPINHASRVKSRGYNSRQYMKSLRVLLRFIISNSLCFLSARGAQAESNG